MVANAGEVRGTCAAAASSAGMPRCRVLRAVHSAATSQRSERVSLPRSRARACRFCVATIQSVRSSPFVTAARSIGGVPAAVSPSARSISHV